MRYKLPIDRLVNQLVPHYLSGRRFILFVQSCLYPLQGLNERFRTFARERHIEARMTSQVIYFEWYLNYRFGKYLKDGRDRIFIRDSESLGVDLYHEKSEYQRPCTLWFNGEEITATDEAERPRPFYRLAEEKIVKLHGLRAAGNGSGQGARLHAVVRGEPLPDRGQDLPYKD